MVSPHLTVLRAGNAAARPVVLLHGSEGTERDLLPFAARIAAGATSLGVRGSLSLGEGYAFFRRFADRRIDERDVAARVPALIASVEDHLERGLLPAKPVVVGYSNGAIMGAALVAREPALFAGAVLLRPVSPFVSQTDYRHGSTPVLIIDGTVDTRRAAGDGARLARMFSLAGAVVTHEVLPVGHSITVDDERISREWLHDLVRLP